jgi:gas vesicle protein
MRRDFWRDDAHHTILRSSLALSVARPMQSDTKRRTCRALALFFLLILAALGAIALVDASANAITDAAKRCAPSIWQSQWPIYVGCAIAAHDGLSGGLIGAVVALVAAPLAYSGVREQIAAERNARELQQREEDKRRQQSQLNAKRVAVVCLTPPVRAAAALKVAMHRAIEAAPEQEARSDRAVKDALTHLEQTLASFTLVEAARDLGADDRTSYLEIVGRISTLLSIGLHGATKSGAGRYTVLQTALGESFLELLGRFEPRLAQEITSVEQFMTRGAPA